MATAGILQGEVKGPGRVGSGLGYGPGDFK